MANTIKLRRGSAAPSAGSFQEGEPAWDSTNSKLYIKNAAGSMVEIGGSGGVSDVTLAGNNAFTGANTFTNATGQIFRRAATQDGILVRGRGGGTSSYTVEIIPATLTGSRTVTCPDGDVTLAAGTSAVIGTAQTFTAAQTFRAASALRSEAASTQDAVVIAGRAGGTSSYAVTITPTTLSASRTLTLADGNTTLAAGTMATTTDVLEFSHTTITYASSVALDMAALTGLYRTISLSGNLEFTTSNRAAGRNLVLRLISDGSQRTLTFPTDWKFIGTKPANIAASKTGVLSISFFGTADADCVAAWAVQT